MGSSSFGCVVVIILLFVALFEVTVVMVVVADWFALDDDETLFGL